MTYNIIIMTDKKNNKLKSMFHKKDSYKHRCAKVIFKEWCQQKDKFEVIDDNGRTGSLNCSNQPERITFNYPITNDSLVYLWDENPLRPEGCPFENGYVPTFDECIENGIYPKAIADIMIPHKGNPIYFIEIICDKIKTPNSKVKKIGSLIDNHEYNISQNINYFEIDADWILKQTEVPNTIKARFLYYDQQTSLEYTEEIRRERLLKKRLEKKQSRKNILKRF